MKDYRRDLIELAVQVEALRFGSFTLKSGRVSPYFFNAGAFHTGHSLARLGRCYASALLDAGVAFDMLFGPAYKGIPLACTTAMALAGRHDRNVPWAFNRKEAKDHGEGGDIVGAPLAGRVVIVDDVISAGTAAREALSVIRAAGATPAALLIALDRQERGEGARSAVVELAEREGLPVIAAARLDDLVEWLESGPDSRREVLQALRAYRERYGAGAV